MRTSMTFARTLTWLGAALAMSQAVSGCDVFDASLYQSRATFGISDRCERDVPLVASNETRFFIDTSTMNSDYRDFSTCQLRDLPGNDGFVRIETSPGEKWHVHVEPEQPDLDPAIYLLPGCDVRTCQPRAANDACGAGRSEHLSFVSGGGSYLVGVDSRLSGGGRFSVIVTRPVCGNGGTMEHSEACEDGNTVSGDRCDSLCRIELSGVTVTETESNELPAEANVVTTATTTTINGKLADRCGDIDVFGLTIAEGGSLSAQLSNRAGTCAAAPVKLALIGPDGQNELGEVSSEGATCPAIDQRHAFSRGLQAGMYYLRVTTAGVDPMDYQVKLERR